MRAAQARRSFRLERVRFWTRKKAEIKAEIEKNGIVVDEGVEIKGYSGASNYQRPAVRVDSKLASHMSYAHERLVVHRDAVVAYDNWIEFLEGGAEDVFDLTFDDWQFFFGTDDDLRKELADLEAEMEKEQHE